MQVKSKITHYANSSSELCLERTNPTVWNVCPALCHLQVLEIRYQANVIPQGILIITGKQRAFPSANNSLRWHIQEIPRITTCAYGPSAADTSKRAAQTTVRVNIVVHLDWASTDIKTLIVNCATLLTTAVKKSRYVLVSLVSWRACRYTTCQVWNLVWINALVAF